MPQRSVTSETAPAALLVVDDDVGMAETLADILEATGYQVTTARSGQAALERVQRSLFDLALMDIQMPGLNGVETLEAIRPLAPAMPVIFMTAYMRDELAARAHEAAVAVLPKPLNVPETLALIEQTVRRRRESDPD